MLKLHTQYLNRSKSWAIALLMAVATGCIPSSNVSGASPTATQAAPTPTVSATLAEPDAGADNVAPNEARPDEVVAQAPDCASPQTQADINQCAAKSAEVADDKLNEVYQQLKTTLTANEQKLLTDAQLAWIEFRDKNCAFSSGRFEGGSIAPTVYSTCIERTTQQRTEELQGYTESLEDGGLF